MAHKTTFRRKLQELWTRRISRVLKMVAGGQMGTPYRLNKRQRDRLQKDLIKSATKSLIRRNRRVWAGHGGEVRFHTIRLPKRRRDRRDHIWNKWEEAGSPWYFIYAFFRKGRCFKVGRTTQGARRLWGYGDTTWLRDATVLYLIVTRRGRQRNLPKYECIYHHLYNPLKNDIRPSQPRYTRECPICAAHREIKDLIRLFHHQCH